MPDKYAPTSNEGQKQALRDYHHWIVVARTMVHDSFTGDDLELQRLTLQAATGMMLQHKLGEIENALDVLKDALITPERS